MTENEKILTQINKTAQIGQYSIHQVLPRAQQPALRQALQSRLEEYREIENEAQKLADAQAMRIRDCSHILRQMIGLTARARLAGGDRDSQIAGMMIQGGTRGMIQSLKGMHQCRKPEPAVARLSQKMLDAQNSSIQQFKGFL